MIEIKSDLHARSEYFSPQFLVVPVVPALVLCLSAGTESFENVEDYEW